MTRRLQIFVSLLLAASVSATLGAANGPGLASRCPCSVSAAALRQTCAHDARNTHGLMQRDCSEEDGGSRDDCLRERASGLECMLEACRGEHRVMVQTCDLFEEDDCRVFRDRLPVILGRTAASFTAASAGRNWSFRVDEGGGRVHRVQVVTADAHPDLDMVCAALRETVLQDGRFVEETYRWYTRKVDGDRWEARSPEAVEECLAFALESSEFPENAERRRDPEPVLDEPL